LQPLAPKNQKAPNIFKYFLDKSISVSFQILENGLESMHKCMPYVIAFSLCLQRVNVSDKRKGTQKSYFATKIDITVPAKLNFGGGGETVKSFMIENI
jgi:hypothetical protein